MHGLCTDLWRLYSILLAAGFKTHLTGGFKGATIPPTHSMMFFYLVPLFMIGSYCFLMVQIGIRVVFLSFYPLYIYYYYIISYHILLYYIMFCYVILYYV